MCNSYVNHIHLINHKLYIFFNVVITEVYCQVKDRTYFMYVWGLHLYSCPVPLQKNICGGPFSENKPIFHNQKNFAYLEHHTPQ